MTTPSSKLSPPQVQPKSKKQRLDTFPPDVASLGDVVSLEEILSSTSEEFDEVPPLDYILVLSDEDEGFVSFAGA
ncbi:hypothetical protein TgHK011_000123 [Trichoderma gracile]|nr:hypothetical protein TgHK011_000123 [Trichoderma gracile]